MDLLWQCYMAFIFPDYVVRMIALQIRLVQRVYQLYINGAVLGDISTELESDQVGAQSVNSK